MESNRLSKPRRPRPAQGKSLEPSVVLASQRGARGDKGGPWRGGNVGGGRGGTTGDPRASMLYLWFSARDRDPPAQRQPLGANKQPATARAPSRDALQCRIELRDWTHSPTRCTSRRYHRSVGTISSASRDGRFTVLFPRWTPVEDPKLQEDRSEIPSALLFLTYCIIQ